MRSHGTSCHLNAADSVTERFKLLSPSLPSKFADYIMTGKTVLAVTPPNSAVREYLGRYSHVFAVAHSSDGIYRAICQVIHLQSNRPSVPANPIPDLAYAFGAASVGTQYFDIFHNLLARDLP